jgi:hypothetical protein
MPACDATTAADFTQQVLTRYSDFEEKNIAVKAVQNSAMASNAIGKVSDESLSDLARRNDRILSRLGRNVLEALVTCKSEQGQV